MGVLDFLTGSVAADSGAVRISPDALYARLLSLRDVEGGWYVRAAHGERNAHLVAEWGPLDLQFRNLFGEYGMRTAKRVLMRIDDHACAVRSIDEEGRVTWEQGWAMARFEARVARGQSRTIGGQWRIGTDGVETSRTFDTGLMKQVLRDTVTGSGWGWSGVVFGRL